MKIATWNLQRPTKTSKKLCEILTRLKEINADILILTETNECVDLGTQYQAYHTAAPDPTDFIYHKKTANNIYKPGERRVSIYSKYPFIKQLATFNDQTSICIKLETPLGHLAVYATVIGVFGNREESFKRDLDHQLQDFKRIARDHDLCIAGDLNISFADNYYHTNEGRDKLNLTIKELNLRNMIGFIPENIDHIIITNKFVGKKKDLRIWNTEKLKRLSDHMGVMVAL